MTMITSVQVRPRGSKGRCDMMTDQQEHKPSNCAFSRNLSAKTTIGMLPMGSSAFEAWNHINAEAQSA
jgi:hypothetical protein